MTFKENKENMKPEENQSINHDNVNTSIKESDNENSLNQHDKSKNESTLSSDEEKLKVKVKDKDMNKTRICPHCKQEYKIKVGIDNWRNLFRKPTTEDWISLIILILIIAAAYAYKVDTGRCSYLMSNLGKICTDYNSHLVNPAQNALALGLGLTNLTYNASLDNSSNNSNVTADVTIINDTNTDTNDSNSSGLIGGEKDEHGCVIPAGYSWCESKQKCLRTWEENCTNDTNVAVSGVKVNVSVTVANQTNANETS